MSVATVDMQAMSDEELREAFASDQGEAALAEAERRDLADREAARLRTRTEKACQAQQAIRDEWYEAAYQQYLAASASPTCKGNMFSAEGKAHGPADEFGLWSHRTADAMRWASPELIEFWDKWPRVSLQAYTRQRAAAIRAAKADSHREAGSDVQGGTDGRNGLDATGTGSVRHEHSTRADEPVRPDRGARETGSGAATGSVRRGGSVISGNGDANTRQTVPSRVHRDQDTVTGTVVRRPDTSPARPAVDAIPGDQLLNLLRKWIGTYARFPSPAALDAVTLWVAHSHMRDEKGTLVFRATPRLYLLSSEPGSGKSKVLELCNMLCPATYGLTLEPTAAGLTHTIGNEHATVFIDEGDVMFGAGQRKSAVRAVINGGYERHGTMLNGKGSKATRVPVFGALALAGLDVLEKGTGDTLTALLSRGVRIRMKKAGKDDRPAKVTRVTEGQGEKMRAWLEAWASQVLDGLGDYQPDMPEEVDGRAEQIWEPLVAVADAAGGEWSERARAACVELALDQATAPVEDEDKTTAEEFASFAADIGGALEDTATDYGDDGEV